MKQQRLFGKITFRLSLVLLLLSASCTLFQTGKKAPVDGNNKNKVIKLGVISGPEYDFTQYIAHVASKRYGLKVELIEFNDYSIPNAALDEGSIDANAFQHIPFLDQDVERRGYKIVNAGKTFIYPLAAYSKKISKLEELSKGAQVAVPNDPSNLGRALHLLHHAGVIALKDPSNLFATPSDIKENKIGLKFVEVEAAGIPRVLPDVDLAVINTTFASTINLSPLEHGLVVEDDRSYYANIVAVRVVDKDAEWVETLVKAFRDPDVMERGQEVFNGSIIAGWSQSQKAIESKDV